jgi:hypothetical protein
MGAPDILALDMVGDERALYRILSAINRPLKLAPTRPWCMHCKKALGAIARGVHCRHCSRLVCGACAACLPAEYFPKIFDVLEPSWACSVCERILAGRREDMSNTTNPASSYGDEEEDDRRSF